MGHSKRWPVLPKQARHSDLSKSTIHEALLDLWMEFAGKGDRHPSEFTDADWREYHAMIEERSAARQRQG